MNHEQAQLALESRLRAVVVATTGSQSLAATTTGYTRATGSFLTDGFAAGMEVTPAGFTQTALGVITAVDDLTMTIDGGRTVQSAGAGRSLIAGLPALRAWENLDLEPITGRPYVEGDYVPATRDLRTIPSTGGVVEDTGLYIVKWYGIAGTGLLALSRAANALLALFRPGDVLALADSTTLRIRETPAPYRGQARADAPGWAVVTVTIPWRLYSTN